MAGGDNWEGIKVPKISGDCASVRQIFRRNFLAKQSSASGTVILDERASRLRLGYKPRVKCKICAADASNRLLCSRELCCIRLLNGNERVEQNIARMEINLDGNRENLVEESVNEEETNSCIPDLYQSKRPRRFLARRGDGESILHVLNTIQSRMKNTDKVGHLYICSDLVAHCSECDSSTNDEERRKQGEARNRNAILHTLHHGSIQVEVVDVKCVTCRKWLIYDGQREGIVLASKRELYTRELLDSWTYEICGTGNTFRDSFDNWFERCRSVTAEIHRMGERNLVGRRQENNALSLF